MEENEAYQASRKKYVASWIARYKHDYIKVLTGAGILVEIQQFAYFKEIHDVFNAIAATLILLPIRSMQKKRCGDFAGGNSPVATAKALGCDLKWPLCAAEEI